MDDVLNAHLFHHATFQDLPRHPKLLLNATSFGSHLRFVFTDSAFRELRSSLASFEIASAARTSASFPGAFESVMLKRHGTEPARVLLLYDGGAFDNFGVQSILEFLTRASRGTSLDVLFPKGCVIIVVDASANPHFEGDYAGLSPHGGLTGAFGKRIANAMDAMEIISERDRMAFLRAQGISDDELLGHAVISGLKPCSCHVVHLALRHLLSRKSDDDPSFERRVTRIPTALWIDNEGRADLFAAASVLVRELEESKLFSANLKTSCRTPEAAR
ncbi:MAG: hypothetical protein EPO02_12445 [Nitrospirae bacterium]|nr:MAG: hypothetical protein EPO02_12445 [Nitrospirota bacterium]